MFLIKNTSQHNTVNRFLWRFGAIFSLAFLTSWLLVWAGSEIIVAPALIVPNSLPIHSIFENYATTKYNKKNTNK